MKYTYYVVERNQGEFIVYADDRYYWLYAPPELFSEFQDALNVVEGTDYGRAMGGKVKKVTITVEED